jgi:hypothetical protein
MGVNQSYINRGKVPQRVFVIDTPEGDSRNRSMTSRPLRHRRLLLLHSQTPVEEFPLMMEFPTWIKKSKNEPTSVLLSAVSSRERCTFHHHPEVDVN